MIERVRMFGGTDHSTPFWQCKNRNREDKLQIVTFRDRNRME